MNDTKPGLCKCGNHVSRWEIAVCDVGYGCKHEGSCGSWKVITRTDDPAVFFMYRGQFKTPGISVHENTNHPDYDKELPFEGRWPLIDMDKPDRQQVVWGYPAGGSGTSRFAVWHIGSGVVRAYTPEGRCIAKRKQLEPYTLDDARRIALEFGQSRSWGEPTDEQHSTGLYE